MIYEKYYEFSIFKKLQFIYLLLDKMEYLEWPKKLCFQISVMLNLDILAIQPNFLIKGIAPRFDFFIVGSFLKFLGMVEISWQTIISFLGSADSLFANLD